MAEAVASQDAHGLHPDLEPIAWLLGAWRGTGQGEYPTIEPFSYGEEIRFLNVPDKPFLLYTQKTWALDDHRPLHSEMGYWRPKPGGGIEVILAHPTGIAEIEEGRIEGRAIELITKTVGYATTAKEVTRVERTIVLQGKALRYEVRMAAVGQPLQTHLVAELYKVEAE